MKIFSTHRRKLEPHRRFGSREFQNKIKQAQNYKRTMYPTTRRFFGSGILTLGISSVGIRLLVYAAAALVIYFMAISQYFLVTDIAVAGNSQVSTDQIREAIKNSTISRTFLIPKNHFLLLTKDRAARIITSQLPMVKEISKYDRKFPNRIELEVNERHQGFALIAKESVFVVDDEGAVLRQEASPGKLFVVTNQADEEVKPGAIMPAKLTAFILSMHKAWPSKMSVGLTGAKFPGLASADAIFTTSEGWSAFFDINRPVQAQLNALTLLLAKQVPAKDRSRLAYIDLRIQRVAYICYKGTPCFEKPQEEVIPVDNPKVEAVSTETAWKETE